VTKLSSYNDAAKADTLYERGVAAVSHGESTVAEDLRRSAAKLGHAGAQHNSGCLLDGRSDGTEVVTTVQGRLNGPPGTRSGLIG